jgi:hypothetical protein
VHLFFDNKVLSIREREFKINILDLMCGIQVNLLSKIRPKYFTVSDAGISMLSNETGGQSPCFKVKVE